MKEDEILCDWVHLPPEAVEQSLWECLHDSSLENAISNLSERSLHIVFDIPYLRKFHKFADELRFQCVLKGLQSARTTKWTPWPGNFSIPPGTPFDESERLVSEYHAKWREESDSWVNFESALNEGKFEVEVSDAKLATGLNGSSSLELGVMVDGNDWRTIHFRFESLKIRSSDGEVMSIEHFLGLGRSYWENFAAQE